MRKDSIRGYSLLEIMIATLFVSVVMIGIVNVFSSMVNFQMEALRKGSVTAWTLSSINQMNKELEDANSLFFPNGGATTSDQVLGCTNWSVYLNSNAGGPLDKNQPVTYFYYCLDKSNANNWMLRRITAVSGVPAAAGFCPTVPPASVATACAAGVTTLPGGATVTTDDVLATSINYTQGLTYLFKYDQSADGIDINYVVGNPNPATLGSGPRIINPQTMTVQSSVSFTRPYLNTND